MKTLKYNTLSHCVTIYDIGNFSLIRIENEAVQLSRSTSGHKDLFVR